MCFLLTSHYLSSTDQDLFQFFSALCLLVSHTQEQLFVSKTDLGHLITRKRRPPSCHPAVRQNHQHYHVLQLFVSTLVRVLNVHPFAHHLALHYPNCADRLKSKGESHITYRAQCVIMTQRTRHSPPSAICVISRFSEKSNIFQKMF